MVRRIRSNPASRAGLGVAILVMLGSVGPSAQAPQRPAAAQANPVQARQRLAELTAQLQATGSAAVAAERLAVVLDLMQSDPGAVLAMAMPRDVRAGLPPQAQAFVEQEADLEGDVEVLYEDRDDGSRLRRFLQSGNQRVELHFATEPGEMLSGDRVRVRGLQAGTDLAADGGAAIIQTMTTALAYSRGEQRTLMILVNFQDKPTSQPYTVSTASSLLFGTVNNFDRENSQDQTWLTGDVTGWFTVPVDSTVCDSTAIRTHAQQAAQGAGFDLTAYRRFVYAFPSNSGCAWWGLGQVGGSVSHAWVNGSLATRVVAHELGHNLGVYHARALECGTATLGTSCTTIEYGDPADIMGMSGTVAHFNAFQKERMGWLNYGTSLPILTVTGDGIFTIEPYAAVGSGPKALKILKSVDPTTGRRTWYYIEHRRGVNFDSSLSSNANLANGVLVHTGSEATGNSSYVLDMTPETASWTDPALVVGRSFSDPDLGVTISTVSAGSTGATVQVSFGPQPCVTAAPTLVLSPASQTGAAGDTFL